MCQHMIGTSFFLLLVPLKGGDVTGAVATRISWGEPPKASSPLILLEFPNGRSLGLIVTIQLEVLGHELIAHKLRTRTRLSSNISVDSIQSNCRSLVMRVPPIFDWIAHKLVSQKDLIVTYLSGLHTIQLQVRRGIIVPLYLSGLHTNWCHTITWLPPSIWVDCIQSICRSLGIIVTLYLSEWIAHKLVHHKRPINQINASARKSDPVQFCQTC